MKKNPGRKERRKELKLKSDQEGKKRHWQNTNKQMLRKAAAK